MSPADIRLAALRELQQEADRIAIDAEKVRILTRRSRSHWQRLLARLPITITIHRKKP